MTAITFIHNLKENRYDYEPKLGHTEGVINYSTTDKIRVLTCNVSEETMEILNSPYGEEKIKEIMQDFGDLTL